MSRIIGILNYKGGTGKTTTVVNLATGLALRGARTLCIDMDAQGSLATYLGVKYKKSLTQLLLGEVAPEECIIQARKNLDLIPSDGNLLQAEGMLWQMDNRQTARQLLNNRMKGLNGYDYIILDHSPSISLLGDSGLFYAHEVIVPVSMDYMSLLGVRQVVKKIKSLDKLPEEKAQLGLIVPTFYHSRYRKDQEIMETLQRYFSGRVAEPIRANVKISEASSYHQSIYEYAPRSHGAADYARLVERIANHGSQ